MRKFLEIPAIILAATIGEGVFALPFIFYSAGWFVSLCYLAVLSAIVIFGNVMYAKMLFQGNEKERLLGMVERHFGRTGFWFGFAVIVVGLLLTVLAYLIIGPKFIELAFPWISPSFAFVALWLLIAIPVLVTNARAITLEVAGIIVVAATLLFVFVSALPHATLMLAPAISGQNLFLPFGVILLALAGWTGIEPAYEAGKNMKKRTLLLGIGIGTVLSAVLYALFVAGIFGSAMKIVPDTLSGIGNWPAWKRLLLAALGLFAIGTGAVPITHELRNAFEKDMQWHPIVSRAVIIGVPLLVVLAGFNQFVVVLGLAGGCFISLQYLLILLVGRKTLALSALQKVSLDISSIVFVLAAVYELWTFVVR